jgi:hypothetical protein
MSSIILEGKEFKEYFTLKEKHKNEIAAKDSELSRLKAVIESLMTDKFEEVGYHTYANTKIYFSREVSEKLEESTRELKYLRERRNELEKRVIKQEKQIKRNSFIKRIFRKYE